MNKTELKLLKGILSVSKDNQVLLKEAIEKMNKSLELNNLSGKTRRRRKKDPNAPKGPRGAWILFSNHNREKYKAKYPDLVNNELRKKMSYDWGNTIPEKIKNKYKAAADKDKERYRTEMDAYKKKIAAEAAAALPATTSKAPVDDEFDLDNLLPTKPKAKKTPKAKPAPVADDDEYSLDDLDLSD